MPEPGPAANRVSAERRSLRLAMIEPLIDSAVIVAALTGTTKDDVLPEMLDAVVAAGAMEAADLKAVAKKLRDREKQGSTGIGNGIAVPHVKSKRIEKIGMALARSQDGIDYDAIDGQPVNVLFGLLVPEACNDAHLQILAGLAEMFSDVSLRASLRGCLGEPAILETLLRWQAEKTTSA